MNTFKEHVFEKEFWHNIKLVSPTKIDTIQKAIQTKKTVKQEIGQWKTLKIYMVDGNDVKTKYDMDFVEAGNSEAKDYIPKNEIWIDSSTDVANIKFNIYHEVIERFYMNVYNYDYEKAHDLANTIEKQMRIKNELVKAYLNENYEWHTTSEKNAVVVQTPYTPFAII